LCAAAGHQIGSSRGAGHQGGSSGRRSALRLCTIHNLCTETAGPLLLALLCAEFMCIMRAMIYGYARVSTDGQSVAMQVDQLTRTGAEKIFQEKISGAVTDRQQLKRTLDALDEGDVLLVTRLDRLARSTRDLLNTLAMVAEKKAHFRSLGDSWADTTDG